MSRDSNVGQRDAPPLIVLSVRARTREGVQLAEPPLRMFKQWRYPRMRLTMGRDSHTTLNMGHVGGAEIVP